ncbi:MAG TPA: PAS domain-containing protein, partial [Anaeromyxobacter sp.]|nr:PAS domain-containing protein [Anaeromyxobacter sp.]
MIPPGAAPASARPIPMWGRLARARHRRGRTGRRWGLSSARGEHDLGGVDFSLLESVPDAMVIVDHRGQVLHLNAIAERLFGWPRAELAGKPIEALLPSR